MRPFTGREAAIAAVFSAFGVALPVLFHFIGLGSIFLPMFLPIALAGFFISISTAIAAGIITPLLSSLLTGMPPFFPPIAPIMCLELAVLGGCISLFYRKFRWNVWFSLGLAIICSRTLYIVLLIAVIPLFKLPTGVLTTGMVLSGIPGIILMLAVIPVSVKLIERHYNNINTRNT